jgi:hypothetical protein
VIRGLAHQLRQYMRIAVVACLSCALGTANADLNVPAGGSVALLGGSFDLGCSDVLVAGTLSLGGGALTNVRNLTIAPGGSIATGTGTITLAGNWTNLGAFDAGTGAVRFVDAPSCATTGTISGDTTFYSLSFVSTIGKLYRFAAGSTQRITSLLTITGTTANPIQLQSGTPGQTAFINLTGAQSMNELAVTDLTAGGVWLAPYLVNRANTNSAVRWFGEPDYARIPTLNGATLLLLLLMLSVFGWLGIRRWNERTNHL